MLAAAAALAALTLSGAAYNAQTNEYLVVSERDGAVYAERVSAFGDRLGERRVSDAGTRAGDPRAAAGDDGGYLVVWESVGEGAAIVGQRLTSLGLELGPDRRLAQVQSEFCTPGPFSGCNPDLAHGAGEYLLVWHEDVPGDDFEDEVFGMRLGQDAAAIGPQFQVSFTGFDPADAIFTQATNPAVSWNPTSREFLVAWESFSARPRGKEQEIVAQRVRRDGGHAGENVRVSESSGGPLQTAPSDAAVGPESGSGGWLVAWEERIGEGDGLRVRARDLDRVGVRQGAFDIPVGASGQNPAVVHEPASGREQVLFEPR